MQVSDQRLAIAALLAVHQERRQAGRLTVKLGDVGVSLNVEFAEQRQFGERNVKSVPQAARRAAGNRPASDSPIVKYRPTVGSSCSRSVSK